MTTANFVTFPSYFFFFFFCVFSPATEAQVAAETSCRSLPSCSTRAARRPRISPELGFPQRPALTALAPINLNYRAEERTSRAVGKRKPSIAAGNPPPESGSTALEAGHRRGRLERPCGRRQEKLGAAAGGDGAAAPPRALEDEASR